MSDRRYNYILIELRYDDPEVIDSMIKDLKSDPVIISATPAFFDGFGRFVSKPDHSGEST